MEGPSWMETGTILLIIVGVVLLWLLIDLLIAGEAMTGRA